MLHVDELVRPREVSLLLAQEPRNVAEELLALRSGGESALEERLKEVDVLSLEG